MENTDKIIVTLNNIIEVNNDRILGFARIAKETNELDIKSISFELEQNAKTNKSELSEHILKLGGNPTEGTRNTGNIFRVWMDIKVAITGKDRLALISAIEFEEDATTEVYEIILKSYTIIPDEIRNLIILQKEVIQGLIYKVRALRNK